MKKDTLLFQFGFKILNGELLLLKTFVESIVF